MKITLLEMGDGTEHHTVSDKKGVLLTLCECNLSDEHLKFLNLKDGNSYTVKKESLDREERGYICPYDSEVGPHAKKDYWNVVVESFEFLEDGFFVCRSKNNMFMVFVQDLLKSGDFENVGIGDKFILEKSTKIITSSYRPDKSQFYAAPR